MSHRIGQVVRDLPAGEIEELAARVTDVAVEEGADVVKLGDYGTAVYFIEEARPMFGASARGGEGSRPR
jgi:hypothetical protein